MNEVYVEDEKGIQNLFLVAADANSFNEIIVAAAEGAELPALDRTAVTIPDGGVLVVKVEEGVTENGSSYTTSNEDYVYLYKSGIEQQILTSKQKVTNGTITGNIGETVTGTATAGGGTVTFTVGTTSISNDDSQTAATQIANIPTGAVSPEDLNSSTIAVETKASIEDTKNSKFAGAGTESNPYLITSIDLWHELCLDGEVDGYKQAPTLGNLTTKGYSFKILTDLDFSIKDDDYLSALDYFCGNLYFDNHTVKGLKKSQGSTSYWGTTSDSKSTDPALIACFEYGTIKNLNYVLSNTTEECICAFTNAKYTYPADRTSVNWDQTVTFEKVNISGKSELKNNNYGVYASMIAGGNVILKDCVSSADLLSSKSCSGVFVGKIYNKAYDSIKNVGSIEFINCVNKGTLINTSGYAGMLVANNCCFTEKDKVISTVTVINCRNEGTIAAHGNAALLCGGSTGDSSNPDTYNHIIDGVEQLTNTGNVVSNSSSIGTLVDYTTISGATNYKVMFSFTANNGTLHGAVGEVLTFNADQLETFKSTFTADKSKFASITGKPGTAVNWTNLDGSITTLYKDGDTYYFYNTNWTVGEGYSVSNLSITFIGYDSSDNIVGIYVK